MKFLSLGKLWTRVRPWCGSSALIAGVILVGGRFALEPLRKIPQYDEQGMDPFHAVETFTLRADTKRLNLAFFGSSQSLWSILPDVVADQLEIKPRSVRNLASPGGTPFETWQLIRRNENRFSKLRCAVVEISPFSMRDALDDDPRVEFSVSQHGSFRERMLLSDKEDRWWQAGEMIMPLNSVRRSLQCAVLNVLKPEPGCPIYPLPDHRAHPFGLWRVKPGQEDCAIQRFDLSPKTAASRLVLHWAPSELQDTSLRRVLQWFQEHDVPVLMHIPPVHAEVVKALHGNKEFESSYQDFLNYLATLQPAPVEFLNCLDPAECGLEEIHMSDRTHLNEMGARTYSRFLAEKISTMNEHTGLQASIDRGKGVAKQ